MATKVPKKKAAKKKAASKKPAASKAGPWVLPSFSVEVPDSDNPARKGVPHFSGDPNIGDYYEAKALKGRFPGCGNPPVHLLTVDLGTLDGIPAAIAKLGRVHVVFTGCTECEQEDYFDFDILPSGKLSPRGKVRAGDCDPENGNPSEYTSALVLERDDDPSSYATVGGKPDWAQTWGDTPDCPSCKSEMTFVAQVWQFGFPPSARGPGNHLFNFVCPGCRVQTVIRQMT